MEIKNFGIALVDFVDFKQKSSLDDKLKILFRGKLPEKMAPQRLGGGTAYVIERYEGIINSEFTIPDCFKSMNIYVIQQHYHIYDVICYGELKEDIVKDLYKKTSSNGWRNFLEGAQEELKNFITPHITGMFSIDASEWHNGIILWIAQINEQLGFQDIEWKFPIVYEKCKDGKSENSKELKVWLKENSSTLNGIKFISSRMSWEGMSLVSPQVVFSRYTEFTIIGFGNNSSDDLIAPLILDGLETLLSLIKPLHYSFFRIKQLDKWENKINKSMSQLSEFKKGKNTEILTKNSSIFNKMMNQYNNLMDEKIEFFEFSSQVIDEIISSKYWIEYYKPRLQRREDLNNLNNVTQVRRVNVNDIQITSSLFKNIYLNAKYQVDACSKKVRDLDEKQNIGLKLVHDLVVSTITCVNVKLQRDIKNLTEWLFWLTVAMVVLTFTMIKF